jgi:1-acyl-sn-glycerol-3-phosphate acyltransferase
VTANDKQVSMIVCNHNGFLEILSLIVSPLNPSFVAKDELRTIPLIGTLIRGL